MSKKRMALLCVLVLVLVFGVASTASAYTLKTQTGTVCAITKATATQPAKFTVKYGLFNLARMTFMVDRTTAGLSNVVIGRRVKVTYYDIMLGAKFATRVARL